MSFDCPENPLSDGVIDAFKWISAVSGSTSILGSSLIILIVLRGENLSRIRNRILMGMSIVDLFSSAAYAFSFLPTPQDSACSNGIGNLSTCAAQGFFLQIGLAGPAYNGVLSIYYLMTIRNMTRQTIAEKYELAMHAYAVVPPVITATIGVTNNMYFGQWGPCWFSSLDGESWGRGYWIVISSAIYTAINIACTIICMIAIYFYLRKINSANQRHDFRTRRNSVERRLISQAEFAANESFKQAFLYFCAFAMTYTLVAVSIVMTSVGGQMWTYKWPYLLSATFQPLQGFWNFWAFIRPIISATRRRNHNIDLSFMSALIHILSGRDELPIERRTNIRNSNRTGAPADSPRSIVSDPTIEYTAANEAGSLSNSSTPDNRTRIVNVDSITGTENSMEINNS